MKTTRRDFLRYSLLAGASFYVHPLTSRIYNEASKFLDRIGIATSLANNGILASAGYSYVEENAREFLVPLLPDTAFEQHLQAIRNSALPLEACNSFLPGDLKSTGSAAVPDKILLFGENAFRRAKQAGIKIIVFGSSASRAIPEGFSRDQARKQFIELSAHLAVAAEKHDVILTLEPLNTKECNFINSLAEGAAIVQEVNHKNFRLLADIYHMLMENEDPSNILRYGHLLSHIHIAEKEGRSAPGVNKEDFTPYFKALKEVGYKGRLTIECSWNSLRVQAAPALVELHRQIDLI